MRESCGSEGMMMSSMPVSISRMPMMSLREEEGVKVFQRAVGSWLRDQRGRFSLITFVFQIHIHVSLLFV